MNARTIFPLALPLTLAAMLFGAPSTQAGELSIGYAKRGKHGSVAISIGTPIRAPVYAPPRPRASGHSNSGRWENVCERVWVRGAFEEVWVPPLYGTQYDACGRPRQVLVRAGYWTRVERPGHWEERTRRVWRDAAPSWRAHSRYD